MKLILDVRLVSGPDGKRGLRIWPEVEGQPQAKLYAGSLLLVVITAFFLWAISTTPDPNIKPDQTVVFYP